MKINEITGQGFLNLSIPNADKVTKISEFLSTKFKVTPKYDGVKLTLWRNAEPFNEDYNQNWVVAYKNQVLHPEEFRGLDRQKIENESIGISQYAIVHDFLAEKHRTLIDIPIEHEFFIEFIMRKPTVTRDYEKFHSLIQLRCSPAKGITEGGMLYTSPSHEYVDIDIGLKTPTTIFEGYLNSHDAIAAGICNPFLMESFRKHEDELDFSQPEQAFQVIKQIFLDVPSEFGGIEEGVVLTSDEKSFKLIQEDQHDSEVRKSKKNRWRGTVDEEVVYWEAVNELADQIRDNSNGDLAKRLGEAREYTNTQGIIPWHPKKTKFQIQDDIFLSAKTRILNSLEENRNALFLGKVRCLTKAHANAIREGLQNHRSVTVALTTGKETKIPFSLRKEMIEAEFPMVEVIEVSSGNLLSAIRKCKKPITAVIAGSDRADGYRDQLKGTPVGVLEVVRNSAAENNISASKALSSKEFFEEMTPASIHRFYDELNQYLT